MFTKKLAETPSVVSEPYLKDDEKPLQFLLLSHQKRFSEMKKQMMQLNELINTNMETVCSEQVLLRHSLKEQQQKTVDLVQQLGQHVASEHKEYTRELEEFETNISQQLLESNERSDTELDAELAHNAKCLALLDKTEKCKCSKQQLKEPVDLQPKSNELGTQVFQCLQNLRLLEEDAG